ncbi:Clp protease N-terminal domain-containing protein [Streptomyces indicus]|uniref:Clp amino terminal domain-containing protein, pathogenicity island component n=1 Tax=Streptomyces indicus TaxID=417292 RepID=A0A1G8WNN7_9ACTN|nr:Clp protease N-terminal domain-containing protein [Streptomyces indicus]SDJ79245.1 Clp amino terminal domain-containing protein, pathogenicity island component [Streptomyces indicus]
MFERFTDGARTVVKGAVAHAERAQAEEIEPAHLLLALLESRGTKAAFALDALGVRAAAVVSGLDEARRRGGLSEADAEALAGLGINVGAIVSRVEEAHGEGALMHGRPRRKFPWGASGHRPFTRDAKAVLEQSLRVALARKDKTIGDEHLLLAMTARPGVVRDVLAACGATFDGVERVLGAGNGGAAKAG